MILLDDGALAHLASQKQEAIDIFVGRELQEEGMGRMIRMREELALGPWGTSRHSQHGLLPPFAGSYPGLQNTACDSGLAGWPK